MTSPSRGSRIREGSAKADHIRSLVEPLTPWHGPTAIARHLAAHGYATRSGAPFDSAYLRRLLSRLNLPQPPKRASPRR